MTESNIAKDITNRIWSMLKSNNYVCEPSDKRIWCGMSIPLSLKYMFWCITNEFGENIELILDALIGEGMKSKAWYTVVYKDTEDILLAISVKMFGECDIVNKEDYLAYKETWTLGSDDYSIYRGQWGRGCND